MISVFNHFTVFNHITIILGNLYEYNIYSSATKSEIPCMMYD